MTTRILSLLALILTFALTAGETAVRVDDVPAEVKAAAEKRVKGFKLVTAERITRKGAVVAYELEGSVGDQGYEILVKPDGAIIKVEKEDEIPVAPADLPAAVRKQAESRVKNLVITEAEKEIEDGRVIYEIEGKANGAEYEMTIDESGKLLSFEKEDGNDDDDDEEDDDDDD